MKQPLVRHIASRILAIENCSRDGNLVWKSKHRDALAWFAKEYLPHGSGVDSGTTIDVDRSTPNRLVLLTSFHHMDEGSYTNWTDHEVIVTPSLALDFNLRVTGKDQNGIKDYLDSLFRECLAATVEDVPVLEST
jgi:hypothetical protein